MHSINLVEVAGMKSLQGDKGKFNGIALASRSRREVHLDLNCEGEGVAHMEGADLETGELGAVTFLSKVSGRVRLRFVADGPVTVWITGPKSVRYSASEASEPAARKGIAPSLAKIAERRARNPELEKMELRLRANMERRLSLQAAELAELKRERAARAKAEAEALAAEAAAAAPEPEAKPKPEARPKPEAKPEAKPKPKPEGEGDGGE